MAAKSKKISKVSDLTYSVGRFRFLYYKGVRVSYGMYADVLKITQLNIADYKSRHGYFESPFGAFGGPIAYSDKDKVIKFFKGLLSYCDIKHDDSDIEIRVRYHVMEDDRITCDEPPAPGSGGARDYTKNKGYKNRLLAEAAADRYFHYYSNFLKDNKGKMLNRVRLILTDDQGNVTMKKISK